MVALNSPSQEPLWNRSYDKLFWHFTYHSPSFILTLRRPCYCIGQTHFIYQIPHHYNLLKFTGAIYKFNGSNICNHMEEESWHFVELTDGDPFSCLLRNGNTVDHFGLYLNDIHWRYIPVTVIGSPMNCSPVDGIYAIIVSTTHQSRMCKIMLSSNSERCHFECSCVRDEVCSHVVFRIVGVDGGNICEVIIGWWNCRH